MTDSDSGAECPGARRRSRDAIAFQEYVVICGSCRMVLCPWREYIRSDGNFVWFPNDSMTLTFDTTVVTWRCRRCHVDLTQNEAQMANYYRIRREILEGSRRNRCILSTNAVSCVFATFYIVD